jgi:hypothetical protein
MRNVLDIDACVQRTRAEVFPNAFEDMQRGYDPVAGRGQFLPWP